MLGATPAASILRELAQSKCTWAFHKSNVVWKFTGKMPDANPEDIVLCKPLLSKRTWTFHKSHFVWKLTVKMPGAYMRTPRLNTGPEPLP